MKRISNLIKHPLFSGSVILLIGSNGANFINFLFHFILGRMLKPSNYGELATIISLIGLLGIIPASLNLVAVKYVSAAKDDKEVSLLIKWLKSKVLGISLVFILVFVLVSPIISSFLHIKEISYLILAAVSFLFSLQAFLNKSILQGLLKFKEMIVGMLAENSVKLLISAFLVYFGFQVGGVMLAFVVSAILGWCLTGFYLRNYNRSTKVVIKSAPIIFFVIPVLVQSFSTTSIYTLDVILVKHFFSSHDAGIYAALSNLGKIIFFAAGPIGAAMFPLVSQRYSKGQPYLLIFLYSFLTILMFALLMLIVYWLIPRSAINLLYGASYLEASYLLIWFGIFMTLFTLCSLFISFYLSLGDTKIVILPVIASIAQLSGIWFLHGNLLTVIIVSIVVTALLLGFLLIYFFHRISIPYENQNANRDKVSISYSTSL